MMTVKCWFATLPIFFLATLTVKSEIAYRSRNDDAECGNELNVTWTDLMEFRNNLTHPSEKMLCFFKCKYHKHGNLDEYGIINTQLINFRIDRMNGLSNGHRKELKYCLKHIGSIKSCFDMRKIFLCASEVKGTQEYFASTYQKHQIECGANIGLTWDDILDFHKSGGKLSSKMLCYVKCFLEKEGLFLADGRLDTELVEKQINASTWLNHFQKEDLNKCVRKLPPVQDCEGVKTLFDCSAHLNDNYDRGIKECLDELEPDRQTGSISENKANDIGEGDLCLIKCTYQKDGRLEENGELNLEIVNENIDRMPNFSSSQKGKMKRCLQDVPPIKNCEYMKFVRQCTKLENY